MERQGYDDHFSQKRNEENRKFSQIMRAFIISEIDVESSNITVEIGNEGTIEMEQPELKMEL